ncbi:MAG: hypothetical protein EPO08_03450 [Rhodospirillaceae bacterium]|nr:MAG: hypothetical protein EPO08_03450 [Rhodospirillaceae bacterium]
MPDVTITADILDRAPGPALSTTSDMPILPAEEAPPNVPEIPAEPPAPDTPEGDEGETGAEGEAEAAGEEQPLVAPPKPKRIGPVQQRLNELTTERKVEAARREAAEAYALKLEKLLDDALSNKEQKPSDAPPPPAEEPRPLREVFDTPEAYDEALIEWAATRAQQRAEAQREIQAKAARETAERDAAERSTQQGYTAIVDAHMARRAAFAAKTPDYAEVAESDAVRISMPMGLAIMQNEDGPAVAYYLGQHPEVAEKIAAMVVPGQVFPAGNPMAGQAVPDTQRQLVEMGKVFAIVAGQAALPTPAPPPPPAPINPIRRGNATATTKTLEEIGNEGSMEDYASVRMKQLQAERRPSGFGRVN